MKRLSMIFASLLLTALLCAAAAGAATTYNDTLTGFITAAGESDGVAVVIDAAGDLPGMGKVMLKREGNNVVGGTWSLTVLPPDADASASERGRLSGSVTGGTLSFNADGTLSGVGAVQLTVEQGAGQHAGVSGGTGTLNLSSSADNPSKLTGTLALSF